MSKADQIQKLTNHFKAFGVDDPKGWAESQVNEGIPQYARLVFLKTAWKAVVSEDDNQWIDNKINLSERRPNDPCAAAGAALKKILAAGVSREDITDLVRVMQYETLFTLCYQLSDPLVVEYPTGSLPQVDWALVQLKEDGEPIGRIDSLHEDVLGLDPTGREMRPRS